MFFKLSRCRWNFPAHFLRQFSRRRTGRVAIECRRGAREKVNSVQCEMRKTFITLCARRAHKKLDILGVLISHRRPRTKGEKRLSLRMNCEQGVDGEKLVCGEARGERVQRVNRPNLLLPGSPCKTSAGLRRKCSLICPADVNL
jgi:hypothetical protein